MGLRINMPEVTSQIELINRTLENRNINANSLRENNYFIKELGFTEEEYEFLLYKVNIQHDVAGGIENLEWDALVRNKGNYAEQKSEMEKVYGKLTDEQFKLLWESQYASMAGTSDFAHQQITTASIFHGDSLITGVYTFGKTDDMAGWLGDATIIGDNGEVSFGPEDFKSDLDAVNISYLMQEESISYKQASNQYFASLGTAYTRAEQFLLARDITAREAEKMILDELNIKTLEELRVKQPDSYNFIMCLKTGSNEMRDFANE